MAILAGIDEVGYGPKLGPLVVCATAFRVADPKRDPWTELSRAVSRAPAPGRLAVADSKELYSPAGGVGSLEPAALAFLATLPGRGDGGFRSLLRQVAAEGADSLDAHPWYRGSDFPLPQETPAGEIDALAARLWGEMVRARLVSLGCWAAWTEPDRFNAAVAGAANKADYLFVEACRLVRSVLAAAPGEEAVIRIGKQGGRRFYLPGLVREFGSVWVHGETAATSSYEFREGGRRVVVEFLRDGESRDFALALASVVGKYLREGAMRLFNAWWAAQAGGVRATAGYGRDASRFWREIEPHLDRLRIDPAAVLRTR